MSQMFVIQCPAGDWQSKPGTMDDSGYEYAQHLTIAHYGSLNCVFCGSLYPDFKTLSEHVRRDHPKKKSNASVGQERIQVRE